MPWWQQVMLRTPAQSKAEPSRNGEPGATQCGCHSSLCSLCEPDEEPLEVEIDANQAERVPYTSARSKKQAQNHGFGSEDRGKTKTSNASPIIGGVWTHELAAEQRAALAARGRGVADTTGGLSSAALLSLRWSP